MAAPKHIKPFNLEHARAGAPFCCANGDEVEVLKWDRKHTLCIVGLSRQDAAVRTWRADGSYVDANSNEFPLVMTPLGYIDGKPVFTGDEIELKCFAGMNGDDNWKRVKAEPDWKGTWNDDGQNARWPAPAKRYPVTQMTDQQIEQSLIKGDCPGPVSYNGADAGRRVANAALRHAVDHGYLIDPAAKVFDLKNATPPNGRFARIKHMNFESGLEEVNLYKWRDNIEGFGLIEGSREVVQAIKKAIDGRAARDMAIAEAVRDACIRSASAAPNLPTFCNLARHADLAGIISVVQP
jgi:hypothetical protein